jgi:hypothetical protein
MKRHTNRPIGGPSRLHGDRTAVRGVWVPTADLLDHQAAGAGAGLPVLVGPAGPSVSSPGLSGTPTVRVRTSRPAARPPETGSTART